MKKKGLPFKAGLFQYETLQSTCRIRVESIKDCLPPFWADFNYFHQQVDFKLAFEEWQYHCLISKEIIM